ncbi:MAG: hypothetical protein ABGZ35_28790, partial [Planctomycetaceae bacterium]
MFSPILRSAFFYRRVNVVVALAVAISTAVIGGAMIVGDSVRHSLRQMTRLRLGDVTHVVHGRFVREQLAADVAREEHTPRLAILGCQHLEHCRPQDMAGVVWGHPHARHDLDRLAVLELLEASADLHGVLLGVEGL